MTFNITSRLSHARMRHAQDVSHALHHVSEISMGAPLFITGNIIVLMFMTCYHDAFIRWDKATKTWVDKRPDACAPTGSQVPPKDFKDGTPRSEITCDSSHCMYTNLYYNGGRWYALVDGSTAVPHFRFSRNQEITTMHVEDSWDFIDSVK